MQSRAFRPSVALLESYQLSDVLRRAADRWPDTGAVIERPRRVSFGQLDQQSDDFASAVAPDGNFAALHCR